MCPESWCRMSKKIVVYYSSATSSLKVLSPGPVFYISWVHAFSHSGQIKKDYQSLKFLLQKKGVQFEEVDMAQLDKPTRDKVSARVFGGDQCFCGQTCAVSLTLSCPSSEFVLRMVCEHSLTRARRFTMMPSRETCLCSLSMVPSSASRRRCSTRRRLRLSTPSLESDFVVPTRNCTVI